MAIEFPDLNVGGQLRVGQGVAPAVGESQSKINGAAFIEGPVVMGNSTTFPKAYATVNIGPLVNPDAATAIPPLVPGGLCPDLAVAGPMPESYALAVSGNAAVFDDLNVGSSIRVGANIIAQGEIASRCGAHILSAKKNFDIPHPSKDGWRLRHTCPEGPSNDVYYRGKLLNRKEITLPTYWRELVDPTTITVNLTPIGSHQHIIVKRINDNKIYLQSNGGMPIHCYFHVFGTRADGDRLIAEYEGTSPADYPGDNSQYSISGYHYDVK